MEGAGNNQVKRKDKGKNKGGKRQQWQDNRKRQRVEGGDGAVEGNPNWGGKITKVGNDNFDYYY